jgi:spore germination cell wall hydrolase CwlJ-like protein
LLVVTQARAAARALTSDVPRGLIVGAVIGTFLGAGFLAGGLSDDIATQKKAARIAKAAGGDFSEAGFNALASGNQYALTAALRYDPTLLARAAEGERQAADLSEQLQERAFKQTVSLVTAVANPAARPWTASPLDQARQLDCLTQAVYYEARGETPAGQAAVAQVVLNRVRHPSFPKSICAVVFQGAQSGRGCQFSFACNGAMRARREPGAWQRAERIAERALNGYVMSDIGNATHFHVTTVRPGWRNLLRVGQVGMHVFYRFGGRAGSPGAFVDEPEAEAPAAETPPIIAASLTVKPEGADQPLLAVANAVVDAVVKVDAAPVQAAPSAPAPAAPAAQKPAAAEPTVAGKPS